MDDLSQWQPVLLWASGFSLLAGVLTLLAVPWLVTRLPSDYFTQPRREVWHFDNDRPLITFVIILIKNLVGLVLAILGLIMLVTPGQGLLTLLVGMMLMNFPGKYQLERWLVSRPGVMRGLNWLRRRSGHSPFSVPSGN